MAQESLEDRLRAALRAEADGDGSVDDTDVLLSEVGALESGPVIRASAFPMYPDGTSADQMAAAEGPTVGYVLAELGRRVEIVRAQGLYPRATEIDVTVELPLTPEGTSAAAETEAVVPGDPEEPAFAPERSGEAEALIGKTVRDETDGREFTVSEVDEKDGEATVSDGEMWAFSRTVTPLED